MRTLSHAPLTLSFAIALVGCGYAEVPSPDGPEVPELELPETAPESCANGPEVIIDTPIQYADVIDQGFTRYAEVVAPNGQPIRIFAQSSLSEVQILRARNLLRFFLADAPGTAQGADKSAVADAMADNEAILVLVDGEHREGNEPRIDAQPLYWSELPVEGSEWYQADDYEHRDAGPEEIFHLVHDAGIGTYLPGALPDYQADLLAEAEAAIADGRWGIAAEPGVDRWLDELRAEGSLAQEYIVSVIDSYYGLWGAWDEGDGGMWGVYAAKTRAEVYEKDPAGAALLEAFLPEWSDYEARLDPGFEGAFSMTFDPSQPYTHKSRYLLQATLTGSNGAGLLGNDGDNSLRGNDGDNALDGGAGEDAAIYCGDRADYAIQRDGDALVVEGEGRDTLTNIEILWFRDGAVAADTL